MLARWPIRLKLLVGLGLLVLVVTILAGSGLYATYSYRDLVKSLSWRVNELPVAADLSRRVSDLRLTLGELHALRDRYSSSLSEDDRDRLLSQIWDVRQQFALQLKQTEATLDDYRTLLKHKRRTESQIADNQRERVTVGKIEAALLRVHDANRDEQWIGDAGRGNQLDAELEHLQMLSGELPSHLHNKLAGFAVEVRSQYRTLIVGTWITSITAGLLFALFVRLSWRWILHPLRVIIHGSRRVAGGEFGHRIRLDTDDEMAELAEALNDMTARFRNIRDDLDAQVRERTKQVVRNEQLASVGFLAAGVAHEINNPLASIAMCAESLESRVGELLDGRQPDGKPPEEHDDRHEVIRNYLRMVQDEAFRCKEITEKLLDFSRIGQTQRQHTELRELVRGVVDMVGHLGKYQGRQIEFDGDEPVVAAVNAQEIKQVVLNLLTNALDSLEVGGTVWIELGKRDGMAQLTLSDNGCGMEPDVLEHVFEPFFTRRRADQGTGLGLSITYRIIADHGGTIRADSAGLGEGATFRVRLPLAAVEKNVKRGGRAA
ncbi:MAG: HAMP domain-containing protein [Candidatus Nealsonbacteria bacterium]|nr:HAMP domain-containing protein [Candidatus Nealsonbacteria bacterium]